MSRGRRAAAPRTGRGTAGGARYTGRGPRPGPPGPGACRDEGDGPRVGFAAERPRLCAGPGPGVQKAIDSGDANGTTFMTGPTTGTAPFSAAFVTRGALRQRHGRAAAAARPRRTAPARGKQMMHRVPPRQHEIVAFHAPSLRVRDGLAWAVSSSHCVRSWADAEAFPVGHLRCWSFLVFDAAQAALDRPAHEPLKPTQNARPASVSTCRVLFSFFFFLVLDRAWRVK